LLQTDGQSLRDWPPYDSTHRAEMCATARISCGSRFSGDLLAENGKKSSPLKRLPPVLQAFLPRRSSERLIARLPCRKSWRMDVLLNLCSCGQKPVLNAG
jgi:hypothetical protein